MKVVVGWEVPNYIPAIFFPASAFFQNDHPIFDVTAACQRPVFEGFFTRPMPYLQVPPRVFYHQEAIEAINTLDPGV